MYRYYAHITPDPEAPPPEPENDPPPDDHPMPSTPPIEEPVPQPPPMTARRAVPHAGVAAQLQLPYE